MSKQQNPQMDVVNAVVIFVVLLVFTGPVIAVLFLLVGMAFAKLSEISADDIKFCLQVFAVLAAIGVALVVFYYGSLGLLNVYEAIFGELNNA